MPLRRWIEQSLPLRGAAGARRIETTPDTWLDCARDVAANGGRLLALWADSTSPVTVYAVLIAEPTLLLLALEIKETSATYPSLAELFPAAARMQRAATDLGGIRARDFDQRPWLRHAAWPDDYLPLAGQAQPASPPAGRTDEYRFVRVAGDGVHEIPVGPVHAGIIEPGHFRFSVVGEKVLRLEERLGYVHKGIEQRFTQLPPGRGSSSRGARVGRFGRRRILGVLPGVRGAGAGLDPGARRLAAGAGAGIANASRTISETSARSATMPDSPSGSPSSRGSRSNGCAPRRWRLGNDTCSISWYPAACLSMWGTGLRSWRPARPTLPPKVPRCA